MMKMVVESIIITVVLFQFSVVAFASASASYHCIIEKNYELDKKGIIKPTNSRWGYDFVVDKRTGRMRGAIINHNSNGHPVVLDLVSLVSKEKAYKALTVYKPNKEIDYLHILELTEGKEKPFLFVGTVGVLSGICVDY